MAKRRLKPKPVAVPQPPMVLTACLYDDGVILQAFSEQGALVMARYDRRVVGVFNYQLVSELAFERDPMAPPKRSAAK